MQPTREERMITKESIQKDIDNLPINYKTADIDKLINKYVNAKEDVSFLREEVLKEQQFHRIYFYVSLKQIKSANERLKWLDKNLLFSDWWHTDENINIIKDADISLALKYAINYVNNEDPFIRRWGYVMFISKLCRKEEFLKDILALLHNDDHYYVQMGEAWLIAELAVFFPEQIFEFLKESDLIYEITGKAIQKICDSFRISDKNKMIFKSLRKKRIIK